MQTIEKVVTEIQKHAASKKMKEYRIIRVFGDAKSARQGDVYVMRVPDSAVFGKPTQDRQLAPGTSKGSRHVVAGEAEMFTDWEAPKMLFAKAATALGVNRERILEALKGPAIRSKGAFRITHPEHADYTLPGGSYITWGQLDPTTMRRVQD